MSRITEAVAYLANAYPRQPMPDKSMQAYAQALADLPDQAVAAAAWRLIRRSEWLPSIADIRREVAEARLELPTVEDAWQIARGTPAQRAAAHATVLAAIDDVGGLHEIRTTTRASIVRAQFRQAYESRREQAILEAVGAATPRTPALPAGETLRQLPESERIQPRPVLARALRRESEAYVIGPPTDEEKSDAIRVLRDGFDPEEGPDLIAREAARIFAEAGSAGAADGS